MEKKYTLIAVYSGDYSFKDKSGETINGTAYYVIVAKDDNCKPMVVKCDSEVYAHADEIPYNNKVSLFFDERGKVVHIND